MPGQLDSDLRKQKMVCFSPQNEVGRRYLKLNAQKGGAMRASRVGVVFLFCIAASYASASEIETLFPDGGLRYKSCQINLASKTDGYAVNIKRDCPSGYCYNHQMKGSVEVNAKQIEVFGKTLTNHHKIDRNSKTIAFEVKEYGEWHEGTGIGASIFGTNESVLVGHYYTKLEMRIDKTTGQVVKFKGL